MKHVSRKSLKYVEINGCDDAIHCDSLYVQYPPKMVFFSFFILFF